MLTHWRALILAAHLLATEAVDVVPILDLKGNIAPCKATRTALHGWPTQA